MKEILISIQPQWVEKILNGEKTIEIRKTMPMCELPCKVYIYCTKGKEEQYTPPLSDTNYEHAFGYIMNGKVVAEFTLNKVEPFSVGSLRCDDIQKLACLSCEQVIDYFYKPNELDGSHIKWGYAWNIDNLKIYDIPKELSEFGQKCTNANEIHCRDCKYVKWDSCCKIMSKPLKRPPQSWCYVEKE